MPSNNKLLRFAIRILEVLLCCVLFVMCCRAPAPVYETNDIADYGVIKGNFDNKTPNEFITSFFPEKVSDDYTDVKYHYWAKALDTYSYEAYLEFCIPDTDEFNAFLNKYIEIDECVPFRYDESFMAYVISNVYYIVSNKEISNDDSYSVLTAQIGMILFSMEEQRFVFTAIGLHDGGGTRTEELSFFFDRFHIDPVEFAEHAYDTVFEQESHDNS